MSQLKKLLALETSAKAASCAVWVEGAPLASAWQCAGLTHSRTLMPMVEDMLHNADVALDDLDAIAVAAGPGSFTGLRIGIATAKGLAWAVGKVCIPVSTLEALAWPLACGRNVIFCAMDARREQVYCAAFQGGKEALRRLTPDRPLSLEEAAQSLQTCGGEGEIVLAGDGAALCQKYFAAQGLTARMAPAHLRLQNAVGVAIAAQNGGTAVPPQDLRPVYLRLSQAERERLAREALCKEKE